MAELQIRKKGSKDFYHVSGSYNLSFSDLRIRLDATAQRVILTRENGAFIIDRNGFAITDISVYDETNTGAEETFATVEQLGARLIALGYPAYYRDGEIVLGNLISTDSNNSLILGSDGLLYTPPAGAATNGLPEGGTTGQILKKQSAADFDADWEDESGSSSLEYQTEITTDTNLDGSQKGLNKVYPVNSATAKEITITTGDYVENDVINIERRGQGTVEIIADTGVRIRGVRDINNRYFINDPNSMIALLCRGSEEFAIIGNLTRGYTGAVTTSSYGALREGNTGVDVEVVGTGFSANMLVSVSANATLNSWTFVNSNQITLNLDAVGTENDTVTVTYDNGDVFIDTDAITIIASSYDVNDLSFYVRLDVDANDSVASNDGTESNITHSDDSAVFNGTTSYIDFADDDVFSFENGSITFMLNITNTGDAYLVSKRNSPNDKEYQIDINSGNLRVIFFDQSSGGTINKSFTHSLSTSTWKHIGITKSGTAVKMYVDGVSQTLTDNSSGIYTAMENSTEVMRLGARSFGTLSSGFELDGKMRGLGYWDVVLNDAQMADVSAYQLAGNQLL